MVTIKDAIEGGNAGVLRDILKICWLGLGAKATLEDLIKCGPFVCWLKDRPYGLEFQPTTSKKGVLIELEYILNDATYIMCAEKKYNLACTNGVLFDFQEKFHLDILEKIIFSLDFISTFP